MLKFQNYNTKILAAFKDFVFIIYVIIDEPYQRFAPPEVTGQCHVKDAKLSDSEVIIIDICRELASIDSKKHGFSL